MKHKKNYIGLSALSIGIVLFFWWLVTDGLHLVSTYAMPSPVKVVQTFFVKMYDTAPDGATLPSNILSSLEVALSGYAMGLVIGIPLGIMMAWYKKVDLFARPLFDLLRPVPGLAWITVMITLFGIGMLSKAMVIFLSAFVACVVNSYSGIRQTKQVHLWVGQTFGASNFQLLIRVAIPSALPMIMTGARVALGASWMALVAAEMIASDSGLGFMIQQCRGLYRTDVIIVGMIAIGALGALLTYLLTLLERLIAKGR